MEAEPVRRAAMVIGLVAVVAGLIGAVVARSSNRGEIVGLTDLELNLFTVNVAGGLVLAAVGVLAVISVLSRTPVPLWVASGVAAVMAAYGLLAWRDDTRNPLGFDGRTISLLVGLALSFAALAWAGSSASASG